MACCGSLVLSALLYYSVTFGLSEQKLSHYFLLCQMASIQDKPLNKFTPFQIHNALICSLGTAGMSSSLLTVACLMNKKGRTKNEESEVTLRKSSQAILIMNFGNAVMIVIQVVYSIYGSGFPFINVLGAFGMAILLSALNPLIRIFLSQEIKGFLLKLVKGIFSIIIDKVPNSLHHAFLQFIR
jgi:hypothetical protein